ncbi:MAG: isocitrate/isopropylmalate family dehydrogenase [Verrucomicrobiales bacterium]|nr:isocitrate/isopropylmalate family dehydrogenase [Verrucomicrobiales bacterium]
MIGVDVTAEAGGVLDAVVAGNDAVSLTYREVAVGAGEFLRGRDPLLESAFNACREADAVLLGAMGLPSIRWPDGREMNPQIDLRERLDLYAGLRPIYLCAAEDSPLKKYQAGDIDFLLVRENTEGLFAARLNATGLSKETSGRWLRRPHSPRTLSLAFETHICPNGSRRRLVESA